MYVLYQLFSTFLGRTFFGREEFLSISISQFISLYRCTCTLYFLFFLLVFVHHLTPFPGSTLFKVNLFSLSHILCRLFDGLCACSIPSHQQPTLVCRHPYQCPVTSYPSLLVLSIRLRSIVKFIIINLSPKFQVQFALRTFVAALVYQSICVCRLSVCPLRSSSARLSNLSQSFVYPLYQIRPFLFLLSSQCFLLLFTFSPFSFSIIFQVAFVSGMPFGPPVRLCSVASFCASVPLCVFPVRACAFIISPRLLQIFLSLSLSAYLYISFYPNNSV